MQLDNERLKSIEQEIKKLKNEMHSLHDRLDELQQSFLNITSQLTNSLVVNSQQFAEMTRMLNSIVESVVDIKIWKEKIVNTDRGLTGIYNLEERISSNAEMTTRALEVHFSKEELDVLMIDLNIKPSDIVGIHSFRCRSLVDYSIRHNRFWDLIRLARKERPLALWPMDTGPLG